MPPSYTGGHDLSSAAAGGRATVFQEIEGFFLVAETSLSLFGDGCESSRVGAPIGDAMVVFAAVFVVDDKRIDAVAQAFLDHQHSAHAAIAIFKGVNRLKSSVEV